MNKINSNQCRLCNSKLFTDPVLCLNGMPKAAQYYPEKNEFENDKGIILNIYQCSACGLVQLNVDPVEYFRKVITAASFSPKNRLSRLKQMQDVVDKFNLKGKKVIEVGCGKGNMLDVLGEAGLRPTGLEASAESVKEGRNSGRKMINGYIGDLDIIQGAPFDVFVSLNYLEHLPQPGEVIKKIYENTTPEAVGYITVPNLAYLLKSKCFYEFVADHLSYFTQQTLAFAFESNGFEVISSELINEDNDIAVTVKKRKKLDLSGHYNEVEVLIKNLQKTVGEYKAKGKKVAVWGAGHRTLALLSLSKLANIEYIVDSAKFKQGLFSPVLHLDIVAPEHLLKAKVDLVIIMVPGLYPDEVYKTLKQMNLGIEIALLRDNKLEFKQ